MSTDEGFTSPEDKLSKHIKGILDDMPDELQRVKSNLEFIKEIKDEPVVDAETVETFGYETWDINMILKDNIWNRSIFTVDKLCKMFLKADLEQKKKYLAKKNPMSMNYIWIILLIIGIPVALIVLIFLLPMFGGIVP